MVRIKLINPLKLHIYIASWRQEFTSNTVVYGMCWMGVYGICVKLRPQIPYFQGIVITHSDTLDHTTYIV